MITKLKERTDRYRSLLVEYDITTEADVDPRLLVAWQFSFFRDYHERHRVAFLGSKQLTEITIPAGDGFLPPRMRRLRTRLLPLKSPSGWPMPGGRLFRHEMPGSSIGTC